MFIIQKKVWDYIVNLNGFSCNDESGLKELEKDCNDLNNDDFAEYKIIELENQFLCECCNTIYYDKCINKQECSCGAIRCEFCEDLNDCVCKKNDDDDLETQDHCYDD